MKKRHKIERPDFYTESSEHRESSSSSVPIDDFCPPEGCPERIETPLYPSPTSCLSEERLHELEEKMDAANRLLLDLGLSNEQSETGRRILFDGLKSHTVRVKIRCSMSDEEEEHADVEPVTPMLMADAKGNSTSKKQSQKGKQKKAPKKKRIKKKQLMKRKRKARSSKNMVEGKVEFAGRDFVQLSKNGRIILIPFSKVCVVITRRKFIPPVHEPSLIDIDACFRRELTFNFGETVANDPDLVQLFYRIKLSMYLKTYEDDKITISTIDGDHQGVIKSIHNEKIQMELADGSIENISLSNVCYIIKN